VIEADSYLLERILQNLFSNAAKYAPKGGTIVLSFRAWGKRKRHQLLQFRPAHNRGNKATLFEKYSRLDDKHPSIPKDWACFSAGWS